MSYRISVCIPTYNGEKFIRAQLDSILHQLSANDEVIISDDQSTDGTIRIIESFNDKRIHLLKGQKFGSPMFNLENALNHSTGDIILLADQDDVWLDNKVAVCKHELKHVSMVISDCHVVDEHLAMLHESFYAINNPKKNKFLGLIKNPYLGCCMAFKREILKKALPFPKDIPMHDIWLGNVAAFYYSVSLIKEKLILYRRHGNNASPTAETSAYKIGSRINHRYKIVKNLLILKFNKSNQIR